MSEIEAFPRAVLQHHYPEVPLHGDFTTIQAGQFQPIDVLVGGTPCQSFSIAGLRGGMEDARGNLALEYLRLADRLCPRWLVWENVPGIRSSNGGRDFGAFLGGLGELGYGWAYRSLDAQHFGLAKRRERVFVVGYLGDWRRSAAVLFEPESMRGDSAPSRKAGEDVAPTVTRGSPNGGRTYGTSPDDCESLIAGTLNSSVGRGTGGAHETSFLHVAYGGNNTAGPIDVATAVNAHGGPHGLLDFESETFVTHALRADGFDASEDGTGRGTPLVAFPIERGNQGSGGNIGFGSHNDPCFTLQSSHVHATATATATAVRRLTPLECARLQGFPDDYLDITYRGKPAADGSKYKALGNSMAVPVMAWIGRRIARTASA